MDNHIKKLTYREIESRLKEIIIDICKYKLPEKTIADISETTQLDKDFDFDSVDFVDLVFRIEDIFNLSIPEEVFDDIFPEFILIAHYIHNRRK